MTGVFSFPFHGKELIATFRQPSVAVLKIVVKACRHLAKRALGRRRVEGLDIDQVYLMGTKGLGAAEDLGHVIAGLELVENQDKILFAGLSQGISLAFLGVALHGIVVALSGGSAAHLLKNQSSRCIWHSTGSLSK